MNIFQDEFPGEAFVSYFGGIYQDARHILEQSGEILLGPDGLINEYISVDYLNSMPAIPAGGQFVRNLISGQVKARIHAEGDERVILISATAIGPFYMVRVPVVTKMPVSRLPIVPIDGDVQSLIDARGDDGDDLATFLDTENTRKLLITPKKEWGTFSKRGDFIAPVTFFPGADIYKLLKTRLGTGKLSVVRDTFPGYDVLAGSIYPSELYIDVSDGALVVVIA